MGVSYFYFAIPHDSVMFAKAAANPAYADDFQYSNWEWAPWGMTDAGYDDFMGDVEEMRRAHPGIADRRADVRKCFDVLHFLLSEERRRGEDGEWVDPGTIAIEGAEKKAWLREGNAYTPPAEVRRVAEFLGAITQTELFQHFDPVRLAADAIYGFLYVEDRDDVWLHFEMLRDFYLEVARHPGEGVVKITHT
jgi:hypothetical protein